MKSLNVGTLNVQGYQDTHKQRNIYQDALAYNLQILALTETHVKKEESRRITTKNGRSKKTYILYHGGLKGENPYGLTAWVSLLRSP